MESAIFGLIGVVVGAFLTGAKEWWFQSRKTWKEAAYLSIHVACELELYAMHCVDVVGDDGLCCGQPDERGYHRIQVEAPKFDPTTLTVAWQSLPTALMYEVLDFPYRAETAAKLVSAAFEYAATPPDFGEGFEERQLQYAILGLAALGLADKLRRHAGLPGRPALDWRPEEYMEERKAAILAQRETVVQQVPSLI